MMRKLITTLLPPLLAMFGKLNDLIYVLRKGNKQSQVDNLWLPFSYDFKVDWFSPTTPLSQEVSSLPPKTDLLRIVMRRGRLVIERVDCNDQHTWYSYTGGMCFTDSCPSLGADGGLESSSDEVI